MTALLACMDVHMLTMTSVRMVRMVKAWMMKWSPYITIGSYLHGRIHGIEEVDDNEGEDAESGFGFECCEKRG